MKVTYIDSVYTALVDSGATDSFVYCKVVAQLKLQLVTIIAM